MSLLIDLLLKMHSSTYWGVILIKDSMANKPSLTCKAAYQRSQHSPINREQLTGS